MEIKRLLYEERYTIAGAKKMIGKKSSPRPRHTMSAEKNFLSEIRQTLLDIRRMLADD
jgi:hypothetical protein